MTRATKSTGAHSVKAKSPAFVDLLGRVQKKIEPRLVRLLTRKEKEAARLSGDVTPMVRAVRSLALRGGKRLRPALAVVGAICVTEDADWELPLEAGVSLELLQAYFLIHDDWMDHDDERRGGPTAHVELARHFGSEELGAASAILAGDFALALATAHFATLALPSRRWAAALTCFADMQIAALHGQQLDIVGKTPRPELTYELKTASYTVLGPLELGAILAGGRPSTIEVLRRYARPTGIAFQLRDDLIGVFGDPKRTGKPRGGDLLQGKNTALVAAARKLGDAKEIAALEKVLGRPRAAARDVERAMAALESSGARAATEARIEKLVEEATAALDARGLTTSGRELLRGALDALAHRAV